MPVRDDDPLDDFKNPAPFPQPNWDLINALHKNPPPIKALRRWNKSDSAIIQRLGDEHLWGVGMAEVYQEAVTAHAMLDMAGFPCPIGYAGDLDARVSTALQVLLEKVVIISDVLELHSPSPVDSRMCGNCDEIYPCRTARLAKGDHS